MFSELPKLLDRDFAIGFFLPAAALYGWALAVLHGFGFMLAEAKPNELVSTAVAVAIVWFLAIGLMALNYPIVRLLEGYGDWHPLKSRKLFMQQYFKEKIAPTLQVQAEIDA